MTTVGDAALHRLFDTLERLSWPNPLIGNESEAEKKLIAAVNAWILLRQPQVGTPKELRETEVKEREARFALANAATEWAYFKRDPYLIVHGDLASGIEARQGGDADGGSVHESPAPKGDAPGPSA